MRIPSAVVVATVVVALPSPAHGSTDDEDVLRLTWTAPTGCPSGADVRAATLRVAETRDGVSDVLEAQARVERRDDGEGWRVRLRTRRGATIGEREIEAATCSGLADATAVVLALALAPPGDAEEARSPEAPAPRAKAPSVTDRGSREAAAGGRTPQHVVALGASVAGDASTLRTTALGGSLTLAWTPGRVRVEVDARRWAAQSASVPASAAGARFEMTSLGGRGCWRALATTGFDLAPCAGADVQLVTASGYGADANFTAKAGWAAFAGGALARLPLASWIALRARLEAFVPLSRPTFVVENDGLVHRPPTLGAAASLGAEALFL
ncbi:MAG: hypothetical protein KF795_18360 [Labilithrix sp.]|nr:hypothetical protein [Labilithrix sp.]